LAVVAAGRESVRHRVAAVLSFGGHADLGHVLRYLCDGTSAPIPSDAARLATGGDRIHLPKPHDYGAVVALLNLAPRMVPAEQVEGLQQAVTTFLRASSIDRLDRAAALSVFAQARRLGETLPEPSRTLMGDVSDRDGTRLGRALAPMLSTVELPAALSPARSPLPTAPVFLLHGADDSVVPATEMLDLARLLRGKTEVRALASQLITHAETTHATAFAEMWRLAGFWADLLRR
jgi:pimeloyl-ACP methyl ester carboxylesterase